MQPQQSQFENAVVIRAHQRKRRDVPGTPTVYQELSPTGVKSLVMLKVSAAPGESSPEGIRHGGDENLLLLAGKLEVDVEGMKYTMGPGDSIFVPRGKRHRVTSIGTETAEAVFVISPPEY